MPHLHLALVLYGSSKGELKSTWSAFWMHNGRKINCCYFWGSS